jgi:polyferredoxin
MGTVFTFAIIHSGGDFTKLSTAFYRFMGVSFIVGIIMGILFKPRSWCVVCPMGHATQVIKEIQVAKPQVTTASNRFTTGNN